MTWTKISDSWTEQPAFITDAVSRDARLLLLELIVWANRHNLDGRIPQSAVGRITDSPDVDAALDQLISARLIEVSEGPPAAYLVDWSDQLTATEVQRRRDQDAGRQKRRRMHMAGDHSECSHPVKPSVTRDSQHESRHPDPTDLTDPADPPEGSGSAGTGVPTHPYIDDELGHGDCSICNLPAANRRHKVAS